MYWIWFWIFPAANHCVITMQIYGFAFSSYPCHGTLCQCLQLILLYVLFVPSVSQTDGDKKKKQKGKGSLEPNLSLPTKLATLKVLSSQTLQVQ